MREEQKNGGIGARVSLEWGGKTIKLKSDQVFSPVRVSRFSSALAAIVGPSLFEDDD